MATIEERNGTWRVKIRIRVDGRLETRSATRDTRREAERWAQAEEAAIRAGSSRRSNVHGTTGRMLEAWFEHWSAHHPKTPQKDLNGMSAIVRWWTGRIGKIHASKVRRSDITQALADLRAGQSPSGRPVSLATSDRYSAWCSAAFTWGIKEEWCDRNPARGTKAPKQPHRLRYLSSASLSGGGGGELELERLLGAVAQVRDSLPTGWRIELAVHLALATGARQGELMAATWGWIDFERGTLTIPHSKSKRPRQVPLAGRALELLRARRAQVQHVERFRGGDVAIFESWFPVKQWRRVLELAGIEHLRFHDLRHTAATYLTAAGVPTVVVQSILGHATMQTTQRYAHAAPSVVREASAALAAMIEIT